jgi:5,10-methylenetetrahydromethanopterin reductase
VNVIPEFGFSITPGPAGGVADELRRVEMLGYQRVGIWDSPALFREPWAVLGAIAPATTRLRLGTWVTNPLTRHPLVTASAAATVDDLAPGRVYLGIGSGGTGAWNLGLETASLASLERYVEAVRGLLRRGTARFEGADLTLPWPGERDIPIILGAHGPRSLRLAGRIADGVIIGLGVSSEAISGSLELLAAGAAEAGRAVEDIETWFTCFWFVDEKQGVAAQQGRWASTAFALHFVRGGVEGKFLPEDMKAAVRRLGEAYDLTVHGSVPDSKQQEYVDLAERLGVADYLLHRFVFAGTPAEVESQVHRAMRAGACRFDGAIDADLPEHEQRVTQWATLVLPRLRTATAATKG